MSRAWLAAPQGEVARLARFGVVGIAATATYFLVATGIQPLSSFRVGPTVASIIASAVSMAVSYFGHHKFTFGRTGDHDSYLPRFLLMTALLSAAAAGGTWMMTSLAAIEYRVAALVVTCAYPPASYVLNRVMVFHER